MTNATAEARYIARYLPVSLPSKPLSRAGIVGAPDAANIEQSADVSRTPEKDPIAEWQTRSKLVKFIKALEYTGRVDLACKAAKAARGWVYEWRDKDADFADNWVRSLGIGKQLLKDEAYRRAYDGVREPRFHLGEVCGHVQKYSDTLLMFLIKQSDPTYREHFQIDHGNAGSRPFIFQMLLHPDATNAAKAAQ